MFEILNSSNIIQKSYEFFESAPPGGITVTGNKIKPENTTSNYAFFGSTLPNESCYFDIEITGGSKHMGFTTVGLGICNNLNADNWDQSTPWINPNKDMLIWHHNGYRYGGGLPGVQLETGLQDGTYRFAFNYDTKTLYMARILPTNSTIMDTHIPSFTGTLKIFYCTYAGFEGPEAIISNVKLGSGGLY